MTVVAYSKTMSTPGGIRGMSIAATRIVLAASQPVITSRRGSQGVTFRRQTVTSDTGRAELAICD
jgi:hypothetical protein